MTCSAHPGMPLLTECSSLTSRLGEPISLMRTLRLRGVGRRLRPGDLTPWPLPFAGRPSPNHLWLPRSDTELRGKEDINWRGLGGLINRHWFLFKLQRRDLAGTSGKSCPLLLAGPGGQAWMGCSLAGQAGPAWGEAPAPTAKSQSFHKAPTVHQACSVPWT